MAVPFHVKDMLNKVRARFEAGPLQERMLPKDSEFTTLRPVRKATTSSVAKYWDKEAVAAKVDLNAAVDADGKK